MKASKNMIGSAGEYFVCAELCKQNILALLTPKNNPLFDVVASLPTGKKSIPIQVKTMGIGNKIGWRFSMEITRQQNNPNLFVVLVQLKENEPNDYYVYQYDELVDRVCSNYASYLAIKKRDGSKRKDVDFRWFDQTAFVNSDKARKNKWSMIIDHLNAD